MKTTLTVALFFHAVVSFLPAAVAQPIEADVKQFLEYKAKAEKGDAEAQNNLGNFYRRGHGVARDMVEAAKWYRKAAEQGSALAQEALGGCYQSGAGVQRDFGEAVRWFRKAAEQGHASAQHSLGASFSSGRGVEKDLKEAVKWYRKAADQNYAFAQYSLGLCYKNGEGVRKDDVEARSWYIKAAERNDPLAQARLGDYFLDQVRVAGYYNKNAGNSAVEAYAWLTLAARGAGPPPKDRNKFTTVDFAKKNLDWLESNMPPQLLPLAKIRLDVLNAVIAGNTKGEVK